VTSVESPEPSAAPAPPNAADVVLSFVVIGFNEAGTIGACLASAHGSNLPADTSYEVIYVDGGSRDNSIAIARSIQNVRVLGADGPRRAAENRNVGFAAARGRYVQFVDGDMVLDPDWAGAAMEFLNAHPGVGIAYGRLEERNPGRLFQALQHDWAPETGEVAYCGGAAMHRREVLERVGGYPEDVRYGEEPYMCWRIRREQGVKIVQLESRMALHDLGHRSLRDYWRQYVRNGAAYIEIASRCFRSDDRLWLREVISVLGWMVIYVLWIVVMITGPAPLRWIALGLFAFVLARKTLQLLRKGAPLDVSLVYALHTYVVKVPLAWGMARWTLQHRKHSRG
jgi:glycosyltransferase involved in cell wall biosynthesis